MQSREPKLLLLHGFLSGSRAWGPLRRELAGVDTVAPDLPGYGRTPLGAPGLALEPVIQHLTQIVEEEQPTHLVGHSMGGIIALALAAEMPGRFDAVGVVGLPVFVDRADGQRHLRSRAVHNMFLRRDGLSHAGCVMMHRTRPLWLPFSHWVLPRQPRSVLQTTFHHSREGHAGGLNAIVFAGHVPALAERVETPVFALHGARDRSAPLDRVRDLAEARGWGLRVAEGCGHQVVVERPGIVADWLRDWLDGPARRPAD